MKIKNLLFAAASGLLFTSGATYAQSVKGYGCFTDEHNKELEAKYPGSVQNRLQIEQQIRQYLNNASNLKTNGTVLKVPVVVHVVTERGLNGISKEQVFNGVQVLNRDFRRLNADTTVTRPIFKQIASDLEIEFYMARKDPQGNPTEGIDRVTSFTTNGPLTRDDVKAAAPAWPTDKYFNVWLVQTINSAGAPGGGTILGYAQFPGSGSWNTYGLVMLHTQWGVQGAVPGSTANSDGRTATHEAGHCFNLYHTFQGGCGSSCTNSGDLVCDTPPALQDTYLNCNNTLDNCTNDKSGGTTQTNPWTDQTNPYIVKPGNIPTQTENYMSYDNCQNMFTKGQNYRSHAALSTIPQLLNLTSSANATFTAIDPTVTVGPLVPMPYFGVTTDRVCAGSSITIKDASYNGTVTSWSWSFPGGTPSTSNLQNPVVTYAAPGNYAVTLVAGNAAGSRSTTVSNFIHVIPSSNLVTSNLTQAYTESFEDPNFPTNSAPNRSWEIGSSANPTAGAPNFEQTPTAFTTGTMALRIRNGASSMPAGTVSSLISPNIDVTGNSSTMVMAVDIAYARKSATSNDELRVYISNDCGSTWLLRATRIGTGLATSGGLATVSTFINGFTPSSASEWYTLSVPVPSGIVSAGKVMFKIEVTSNGGNSLFIDNFRFYNPLGTNETLASENQIKVYPNPVTTATGVSFKLATAEKVSVKIYDLLGNTIYQESAASFAPGSHTINLASKLKNAKAGMYMLEVKFGNKVYNTKLIAQ